ncbi:MAG: DCC1-like thiol-disulfide oxidoreductase family protein [Bacteroidales bacterium]|nr:DCC1-like thiol-disulfide oxidoreductase family protein [Bacteroidales bacterium]
MRNPQIFCLSDDLANMQPIVLFDGECALCSRAVRFLLRHNHSGNLRFTSIQSEFGSVIVKLAGKTYEQSDTLLFLQDNMLYGHSAAALKLTAHLRFPWCLLRIFILVPPIVRDAFYRFIAKNRYNWFGRKSFCRTDETRYKERFLG